jgi:FeS assembly protein IscX
MNWTDSLDIAIALDEAYPDINPLTIGFVDLKKMIITLEEFNDDEKKSGEKILEAIQMNWIEEKE